MSSISARLGRLILPVMVSILFACENTPPQETQEDTLTLAQSDTPAVEITAETLLGLRHNGSPFGNRAYAGWLLPDREDGVVYSHGLHTVDEVTHLLLNSRTHRIAGLVGWKVVGVLELPPTMPEEIVLGGLCQLHGTWDPYITAIIRLPEGSVQWYEHVRLAWRVDIESRAFEVIDLAGVRCANDGYGAD